MAADLASSMSEYITDTSDVSFCGAPDDHTGQVIGASDVHQQSQLQSARIAIRVKGKTRFISTEGVIVVRAQGNYVLLQCKTGMYPLRVSITALQEKLEPYGFVRIHRSVLVNRAWVEEIQPHLTGHYGLRLRGGKEFQVSRTYKKNLKSLAELWLSNDSFLDK